MKTVYIHIGFPKTGTTSIQASLEAESLKGADFLYPCAGRVGAAHHFLFPINTPASGRENTDPPTLFHRLKQEMQKYTGGKIILSTENLSYATPNYIKLLRQSVDGMNPKIIVYLRDQVGFIASSYLQWVRMLCYPFYPSINSFIDEHAKSFDYRICLAKYVDAFGLKNIIVRHYQRDLLLDKDVVSDFCSLCDIKLLNREFNHKNPSLIAAALPLALKINQLDVSASTKHELMNELNALATHTSNHSRTEDVVDAHTRKKIHLLYEECNEQLFRDYGIHFMTRT